MSFTEPNKAFMAEYLVKGISEFLNKDFSNLTQHI